MLIAKKEEVSRLVAAHLKLGEGEVEGKILCVRTIDFAMVPMETCLKWQRWPGCSYRWGGADYRTRASVLNSAEEGPLFPIRKGCAVLTVMKNIA
jgi:hypothetical protein